MPAERLLLFHGHSYQVQVSCDDFLDQRVGRVVCQHQRDGTWFPCGSEMSHNSIAGLTNNPLQVATASGKKHFLAVIFKICLVTADAP